LFSIIDLSVFLDVMPKKHAQLWSVCL